ncbi:hypothetical protein [Sanguibacter sp. 25GB23B1]|uniref:hypothetical protein n=1 Tax=unclassified Sanguibacter TaxID=2645534 RepID=UPI0032AF7F5C
MSADSADGTGRGSSSITQITVIGGVTRMDADTVSMAEAARLVATAASHLASARLRCTHMIARIGDLTMLETFGWGPLAETLDQNPGSNAALHLDQAETSLVLARTALALQKTDLEDLSVSTLGAADRYSEAEETVAAGLLDAAGGVSTWSLLSPFALQSALAFASTATIGAARSDATSWRDRVVGGGAAVVGGLNPRRDPFSTPGADDASMVLGAGAGWFARWTGPGSQRLKGLLGAPVTPRPALDYRPGHLVQSTRTVPPITSALDAADAVGDLPDRSVSVLRSTHLDGTETWAVFVRGTDDWGLGSDSPFSGEANLDLMAGGRSEGMTLVESALQQAGAPVGAAVGLYGHSQGGIVAMRLSDDPVFRKRYDLRSVTTFGSPTATLTQSSPVPTLHVENNQEWVSSADASVSRGTTDRVTVSADLPDGYTGSPHSMSTHREVLGAAVVQGDPAVLVAVEQQQAVLGGPAFAGSTTLPLPDVEITVFSPGPPTAQAPAPGAVPPMFTATPTLPGAVTWPDLDGSAGANPWAQPEMPRTEDGAIDWDEATRRARPGLEAAHGSGR